MGHRMIRAIAITLCAAAVVSYSWSSAAADLVPEPVATIVDEQIWDYKTAFGKWIFVRNGNPALKLTCTGPFPCNGTSGLLRAPSGYKICRAMVMVVNSHVDWGVTFNTTMYEQSGAVGWSSAWRRHSPNFRVRFTLRPDDGGSYPSCHVDGRLWDCAQRNCGQYQDGAVCTASTQGPHQICDR